MWWLTGWWWGCAFLSKWVIKTYQDEGGREKQSKDNTPLVVCDRAQVLRNLFMTPQGSGCVRQTGADHGCLVLFPTTWLLVSRRCSHLRLSHFKCHYLQPVGAIQKFSSSFFRLSLLHKGSRHVNIRFKESKSWDRHDPIPWFSCIKTRICYLAYRVYESLLDGIGVSRTLFSVVGTLGDHALVT